MTFEPEQDDPHTESAPAGLRGRFRDTRPPVVSRSEASAEPSAGPSGSTAAESGVGRDGSRPASGGFIAEKNPDASSRDHSAGDVANAQKASDEDVVRAGGSMAIATLISRITGFLRTVLIGSALGPAVASAFNTANTLPNLITELVLGAVLTSLVVPVLVRAEKEDPDRGAAFIRRLLTITFTLTISITLISVLAAPLLVRLSLDETGHVNIGMSTAFAYLLLPQIVFYAMFAVFMAVLNTKGIFKPGAWAPVVNNVVTLAVLSFYLLLPQETKLQPQDSVTILDPHVLLLGLGTTVGVVVQALIMVPYLKKAGIDVRPLWGIDARLKSFGGMAIAIVVYVAISQVGFLLNNRIASAASAEAPTIYMQAWQLLQVPYGVIGVTLLTAVMPRLSRNAADGDDKAVVKDLASASKLTMLALVPVIIYFTAFGTVIARALFAYGDYDANTADILGWTISFSAFTLIPYALVLLHLRVFYAREEVWTPTFIIAGITITKLVLAYAAPLIASEPRLVVVLLGAANGFGFVAGVIIGDRLLRRSLGHLQSRSVLVTSLWAAGAAVVGAFVAYQLDRLVMDILPVVLRLLLSGVVFLIMTGLVLSRSKLPEVQLLGRTLSRFLPARFRPAHLRSTPEQEDEERELSPEEFAARETAALDRMMGGQSMGAGAMLPPMNTTAIRGPRLVPGAPLLNGRYRLLADHGGTPAARFWQATEMATGKTVALTIMDPTVWADTAKAKDDILRRSAKLKELKSKGMATVTRVIDNGNVVVIVAKWTEGSPLATVAKTAPEPQAASRAVATLADACHQADELGIALGIDHRDRLRLSLDGAAYVAFPGVLPNTTLKQDSKGIATALRVLMDQVAAEDIPQELHDIYQELEELNASQEEVDFQVAATHLREIAGDTDAPEISVSADHTPSPNHRAGFGAAANAPGRFASAAISAFVIVVVAASVVVALLGFVGGNREDSPITPDSIRQGAQSVAGSTEPASVTLSNAREWRPDTARGTADNPERAPLIIDGDSATRWQSDSYLQPLGPSGAKNGIGLMVDLPKDTSLTEATLAGLTPGMRVEIRVADGDVTSLDQTTLLATQDVTAEEHTISLPASRADDAAGVDGRDGAAASDAARTPGTSTNGSTHTTDSQPSGGERGARAEGESPKANRVILWITKLPDPQGQASIGELSLVGRYPGAAKHSTPTPTAPAN
ncbi:MULTISPECIES: murein biosynthesis integral membrane protein MurJ [Corynebacterium]|nr:MULTISPECIES: murein biosynthesis integral membrane protein MurJ [Corynebacterium]